MTDNDVPSAYACNDAAYIRVTKNDVYEELVYVMSNDSIITYRVDKLSPSSSSSSSSSSSWHIENYITITYNLAAPRTHANIITAFTLSSLTSTSTSTLYQDDNGILMHARTPTKTFARVLESTYYPLTTTAFVRDDERDVQLTVMSERTHGVSAGVGHTHAYMEVMLHRNSPIGESDGHGMEEGIHDTLPIRVTLRVMIDSMLRSEQQRVLLSHTLNYKPLAYYHTPSTHDEHDDTHMIPSLSYISPTPAHLHLLSLSPYINTTLLRFAHVHSEVSGLRDVRDLRSVTFPVDDFTHTNAISHMTPELYTLSVSADVFNTRITLTHATRMTLTGVHTMQQCTHIKWKRDSDAHQHDDGNDDESDRLMIGPLQFATFAVELDINDDYNDSNYKTHIHTHSHVICECI